MKLNMLSSDSEYQTLIRTCMNLKDFLS